MDIELNLQYGESRGHHRRARRRSAATYAQVEPLIKALPAKYQRLHERHLPPLGRGPRHARPRSASRPPASSRRASNAEQLLNAGYQKREPWLKTVDIDTDPRYGPAGVGWPGGADPSVSKAGLALRQGRRQDAARRRLGRARCRPARSAADPMTSGGPERRRSALVELVEIMARLRAECGWKAAQTHRIAGQAPPRGDLRDHRGDRGARRRRQPRRPARGARRRAAAGLPARRDRRRDRRASTSRTSRPGCARR